MAMAYYSSLFSHRSGHDSCSCLFCCFIDRFFRPPPSSTSSSTSPSSLLPSSSISLLSSSFSSSSIPIPIPVHSALKVLEEAATKESEKKKKKNAVWLPPPITCLRNVKRGVVHSFVRYDKEAKSYVVDHVKIPHGSLFRAIKKDCTMRLFLDSFCHDSDYGEDDEEEEDEEEVEGEREV